MKNPRKERATCNRINVRMHSGKLQSSIGKLHHKYKNEYM